MTTKTEALEALTKIKCWAEIQRLYRPGSELDTWFETIRSALSGGEVVASLTKSEAEYWAQQLASASANLRSADKTDARVDAAFRIAFSLDQFQKKLWAMSEATSPEVGQGAEDPAEKFDTRISPETEERMERERLANLKACADAGSFIFGSAPSADDLRLHLGEMTAGELRVAKAAYALGQTQAPTAAVSEAQPVAWDALTDERLETILADLETYGWTGLSGNDVRLILQAICQTVPLYAHPPVKPTTEGEADEMARQVFKIIDDEFSRPESQRLCDTEEDMIAYIAQTIRKAQGTQHG